MTAPSVIYKYSTKYFSKERYEKERENYRKVGRLGHTRYNTQTDGFHRNLSGRVTVSESRWHNASESGSHATFS